MNKMDVYNHLPIFAQNMACYCEGMKIRRKRYGNIFWEKLNEYKSHNVWTDEQRYEYRDLQIQNMIKHCYKTVPYYTRLFKEYGINYESVRRIDDLKCLPILTKMDVKENMETLISSIIPKNKIKVHLTGGTTGTGLAFKTTWEEEEEQWAVWWRYRENLGIKFGTWCGIFGGKAIVPIEQRKGAFYRVNQPCQQIFFSGYHINNANWRNYYECIKKHNVLWLHGYPSQLFALAKIMKQERPDARIIPFFHWNYELEIYPQPYQRELARKAIDAGAFAVVGGYSHCVQKIEIYRNVPILYSLGNFMFPDAYFFEERLSFPSFAMEEMGFSIEKSGFKYHKFIYNQEKEVSYVGEYKMNDILAPFNGCNEKEYLYWFKKIEGRTNFCQFIKKILECKLYLMTYGLE